MKTKSIDENGDVLSTLTETLKSSGLGDFRFFFCFCFFYLFICLLACAVLNVDIDIKKIQAAQDISDELKSIRIILFN